MERGWRGERGKGRRKGDGVKREGERKVENERGREVGVRRRGEERRGERQRTDEDNFLAEKPIQRNLLVHSCCETCISRYTTPQIQF